LDYIYIDVMGNAICFRYGQLNNLVYLARIETRYFQEYWLGLMFT